MSGRESTISAVVPTLDEETNLEYLLPTLAWCDEILVVDQGSSDGTRDVAKRNGARVLTVAWQPAFDANRAVGAGAAKGEWILQLDADEMVPFDLALRLRELASRPDLDIVFMPRLNYFLGPFPAGGLWPDYQPRLSRRGKIDFGTEVHTFYKLRSDRILHLPPRRHLALHHFHYRGASHFLGKLDHYTDLEIRKDDKESASHGARAFLWTPLRVFLSRYLKHGAVRYGWRGLWLATFWAFYFFVRAVKSWERVRLPAIRADQERVRRDLLDAHRR